jgi:flavin-dependent dehydrogenase
MQPEYDKDMNAYGKQMMKSAVPHYDVVVVGASVGGSAAAILFAQEGLRVALIERNTDIDAYKKVCTHFIQGSALPIIKRMGVAEAIEAAGGVRNGGMAWTRWGWLGSDEISDDGHGYNVRRQVLDPLLRRRAAETPGVDFLPGMSLRELIYSSGRVVGIRASGPGRKVVEIRAQLVVGADGRYSPTAKLAGLPTREDENGRFMYFAHFRNLPLFTGQAAQLWLLDPDAAYALPNDNGITVLAVALPKSKLAPFKSDLQGNFLNFFRELPDGPNLKTAEQVTEVMGMVNMFNISRTTTAPGLALVGDAALAGDPVWGEGIGRAFQAAEWLVDNTAGALRGGHAHEVDRALLQYRRRHHAAMAGRHARDVDFAQARPFNIFERLMYSAATRDSSLGQYTGPHTTRLANFRQFPPLKAIVRALWVNLTYREQTQQPASQPAPA